MIKFPFRAGRKMIDELYGVDSLSAWEFNFMRNLAHSPEVLRRGLTSRERLMVEEIYSKRIKKAKGGADKK
jgi:hypothetical protein